MMKSLPPLKTLVPFYMVASELSFSRAADQLCVTHSAVSQSIKQLEAFLGKKLFVRTGNTVKLTPDGQVYVAHIKQALSMIHASTKNMLTCASDHVISVNMLSSYAMKWMIPKLESFKVQYPSYQLNLSSEWRHTDFLLESVDIALYYGHGDWPSLHANLLCMERMALFASPDYIANQHGFGHDIGHDVGRDIGHDIGMDDWVAANTFLYVQSKLRDDNLSLWFKGMGRAEPSQSSRLYFQNTMQALQAAQHGAGLIAANEMFLENELANGSLVKVVPDVVETGNGYYVVCPLPCVGMQKIIDFSTWLLTHADEKMISPSKDD
jgi:DNA-binding transcriptional LysR family regulator